MKLLFDIGNTNFKWCVADKNTLSQSRKLKHKNTPVVDILNKIETSLEELPISQILVSTVLGGSFNHAVSTFCIQQFGIKPKVAISQLKTAGLHNAYKQAGTLGSDRWLAMLGALTHTKTPICVVDCGTAVTIDSISKQNKFLGGLILPGLAMSRMALSQNTYNLNLSTANEDVTLFATDTFTGLTAGTAQSIACTIKETITSLENIQDKRVNCIITGGDAMIIRKYLSFSTRYEPDIIFTGLLEYFKPHENKGSIEQS